MSFLDITCAGSYIYDILTEVNVFRRATYIFYLDIDLVNNELLQLCFIRQASCFPLILLLRASI